MTAAKALACEHSWREQLADDIARLRVELGEKVS